ncbi:TraK domain-containing protein [Burkholderia ubonensis]|uniref:TraK domain-containing protein n=1 Tax=Burkholderia ubonensis TaxID=101571 RepID=UPI0009B439BF|nr:type-F conjugative transfer system secretin TraK [Burkholderia ubonensis]
MHFNKNRLFAAIMALGLPMASIAQTSPVIVPPPSAPGASAKAPVAQVAPAAAQVAAPVAVTPAATTAQAPTVLPPTSASSANPAAAQAAAPVTPPPLIDIALPAAPKPDAASASAGDLKPSAPGHAAKKAVKAKKVVKDDGETTRVKAPADPFAGIVGTPVSDSQLNRFVFPEAVEGVFFQEGAPLPECGDKAGDMDPCKPVFLNGKRMMLLQMRAGAKGPVQMLVHLHSGRVLTMNLMPSAGPGAVIRVEGAEDGASDTRLAEGKSARGVAGVNGAAGMTASEENTELLSRFARGDIPAGFEPVAVDGKPIRFELFDVIQRASWENGAGLRAHLFQVKAHGSTPVAISTALFRQENVKALALDRETITNKEPALLYMLEFVPTENN